MPRLRDAATLKPGQATVYARIEDRSGVFAPNPPAYFDGYTLNATPYPAVTTRGS